MMNEFLNYAKEKNITIDGLSADFYVVGDFDILVIEKDLGNYDRFDYEPKSKTIPFTEFKNIILNKKGKF